MKLLLTSIIAFCTVFTKAVPLSYNSELTTRTEYSASEGSRLQRRNPKKGGKKGKSGKSNKKDDNADNLILALKPIPDVME
jgi:hypothetical protein